MTELLSKIKVTEIENNGCNEDQKVFLLDLFITTVKRLIPTHSHEAWFKLSDFADTEAYDVDNFILLIIRKAIYHQEEWRGFFHGDKKRLKVVAIIEKDYN